jgi:hypothetical protein
VFAGYYSDTSDQFSLAITYYVLRTGTFPFPSPPEKMPRAGFTRPPADLSGVTEAERPPLLRALSPAPQDRWPSCCDFMTAILKAHGLKAVRATETSPWVVVKDRPPTGSKSSHDFPVPPAAANGFRRFT